MSDLSLTAERRTVLGKQCKALRRAGQVPGVVYGPAEPETVSVSVERRQFDKFFQRVGHATLFTLKWEDGERAVLIREVQQDAIKRSPLHIDFFAPRLDRVTRAIIPLVLHHPDTHVDGVLTQLRMTVEVEALPAAIPHQVDGELSGLGVGESLRVSDLKLPEGVTMVTDGDEVVAQMSAVVVEAEEAPEAAEEGAEPTAEGAGAETGAAGSDAGAEAE